MTIIPGREKAGGEGTKSKAIGFAIAFDFPGFSKGHLSETKAAITDGSTEHGNSFRPPSDSDA